MSNGLESSVEANGLPDEASTEIIDSRESTIAREEESLSSTADLDPPLAVEAPSMASLMRKNAFLRQMVVEHEKERHANVQYARFDRSLKTKNEGELVDLAHEQRDRIQALDTQVATLRSILSFHSRSRPCESEGHGGNDKYIPKVQAAYAKMSEAIRNFANRTRITLTTQAKRGEVDTPLKMLSQRAFLRSSSVNSLQFLFENQPAALEAVLARAICELILQPDLKAPDLLSTHLFDAWRQSCYALRKSLHVPTIAETHNVQSINQLFTPSIIPPTVKYLKTICSNKVF
jgi:hypothetical protein